MDVVHNNQEQRPLQSGPHKLIRIELAKGLLPLIQEYVCNFIETRGQGIETGGMLTGEFARTMDAEVFRISGFIGAGPNADCLAESVQFDTDYQAGMLELMRRDYPQIGNMGCIHLHPGRMDVCSQQDWLADVEAVRASDTKSLVFGIVTIGNNRLDPLSLYYGDFKFDFYILSQQTGFDYVHVKPILMLLPVIQAESGSAFASREEARAVSLGRHWAGRSRLLKDKKRLVAEVRAMEERYGGSATLRLKRNSLYWEYTVHQSGREFPIRVYYPRRYPMEPPRIYSVLPLPDSPHQFPENELCWTNREGACDWNPARDTAVTCIHAAHRWFACLLVYLTLGKWPTEASNDELLCPV